MVEEKFAVKEYEFKINLSRQIDRIAELLSEKIELGSTDTEKAQKILVSAKLNSVDTLEAMLKFYLKYDEEYQKELEKLLKEYAVKMRDKNSHKAVLAKEEFAEKKFALLMDFMGRKGWLIEEGFVAEEGFMIEEG